MSAGLFGRIVPDVLVPLVLAVVVVASAVSVWEDDDEDENAEVGSLLVMERLVNSIHG